MITNWDQLPVVFGCEQMAELLDRSVATIWKRCQRKSMFPPPITWSRPYMWSKAVVQRELDREPSLAPSRTPKRRVAMRQPQEIRSIRSETARLKAAVEKGGRR